MNYGKRLKLPQSARSESDYSLADDFDEDCRSNKRVNRNLSEKKRRDQFNMLVNELCSMVSTTSKKMDKSTVLKSTIAYLKSYQETAVQAQAHEIKEDWKPSFLSNDEFMHLMLEALDSFILVFTQQGTILYASESITSLLGHLPNDLMNKPVYDYIHENEMQNLFNLLFHFSMISTGECTKDEEQLFFTCHFLRGALSPEESPAYEIVKFTGFQYWNREKSSNVEDDVIQNSCSLNNENSCFCCIVRLQNSQFIREMSLVDESKSEFTSRHSLEWKFLFLDHRAPPIIGYLPFEVLGTSGYDYYHPDDLEQVANCHEQLMQTGEGTSSHYRFLTKGQQWIWIKTRYYITYHQWNSKPEFIVCSNFVVSYADVRQSIRKEVENENKIKNGDPTTQMQRSPSICSVTSGGRVRRSWSSSHSIESSTSDRNVSGSHSLDKDNSENRPHSTNVSKDLPQSVSQQLHLLLQQRYLQQQQQQQIQQQHSAPMVSSQMQNHLRGEEKGDDVASSSSRSLLGLSQDRVAVFSGSHTLPMVVSSTSQIPIMSTSLNHIAQMSHVANSHTNKGVISQPLYLTPIQRQLHEQLHEKSKKLQEMIIKQQEELKQITQQLSLAQQGILPVLAIPQAGSTMVLDTNTSPEMTVAPPTQSASLCGLTIQTMAPIISVQHHTPIQTDQQFLPFQLMPQEAELMPSFSSASPP